MSPPQEQMTNPYGMDTDCTNCPDLVEHRAGIVHGYGDVTADFLFIRDRPLSGAVSRGHPLGNPDDPGSLYDIVDRCGFLDFDEPGAESPILRNAYVTHRTRCRHPDREATEEEISNCNPFLTAEIRSINPEILVPIDDPTVPSIVAEYSREDPTAISATDHHGQEIRGRGFEIVPIQTPESMDGREIESTVTSLSSILDRDYRQTKGRRRR